MLSGVAQDWLREQILDVNLRFVFLFAVLIAHCRGVRVGAIGGVGPLRLLGRHQCHGERQHVSSVQ